MDKSIKLGKVFLVISLLFSLLNFYNGYIVVSYCLKSGTIQIIPLLSLISNIGIYCFYYLHFKIKKKNVFFWLYLIYLIPLILIIGYLNMSGMFIFRNIYGFLQKMLFIVPMTFSILLLALSDYLKYKSPQKTKSARISELEARVKELEEKKES